MTSLKAGFCLLDIAIEAHLGVRRFWADRLRFHADTLAFSEAVVGMWRWWQSMVTTALEACFNLGSELL